MNEEAELQVADADGEYPTEPKVVAARLAAFLATLILAFLLKTLPFLAGVQSDLLMIIADPILAILVFLGTWYAGWKAKHVQRPQAAGNAVLPVAGQGGTNPGLPPN